MFYLLEKSWFTNNCINIKQLIQFSIQYQTFNFVQFNNSPKLILYALIVGFINCKVKHMNY